MTPLIFLSFLIMGRHFHAVQPESATVIMLTIFAALLWDAAFFNTRK